MHTAVTCSQKSSLPKIIGLAALGTILDIITDILSSTFLPEVFSILKLTLWDFSTGDPNSSSLAHPDQPPPKDHFRRYAVLVDRDDHHHYRAHVENPNRSYPNRHYLAGVLARDRSLHRRHHGVHFCIPFCIRCEQDSSTSGSQPGLVHEQEEPVTIGFTATKKSSVRQRE